MGATGVWAHAHQLGWVLLYDPVFVTSAFMVGPKVNVSFFMGALCAWGVLAPWAVSRHSLPSYNFNTARDKMLLWPGVAAMVFSSILMLALQWRVFLGLCCASKPSASMADTSSPSS